MYIGVYTRVYSCTLAMNHYTLGLRADQVEVAIGNTTLLNAWDVGQEGAKTVYTVDIEGSTDFLAKGEEYGAGGQPLAFFLIGNDFVVLMEEEQRRGLLGKLTVVVHDGLYVGSIEPVLLAFPDEGDGLGVELLVVGTIVGVNGAGELDAYEAAASCGIAENTDFVAGGDE